MEIAIPIVVLGGMYVLSNEDNKKGKQSSESKPSTQEGFQPNNRTLPQVKNMQLPNNKPIPQNYPKTNQSDLINNVGHYSNPNIPQDKYYNVNQNQGIRKTSEGFTSLTGQKVGPEGLKHNNMVPFFGSKVTQVTSDFARNESTLDNMNGSGSTYIKKQEVANMFEPQKNMQWGYGTPNVSSFIQSRMNPSMKMSNVKPFEEIRVAPGLNEKGGVYGSGGFNSGMEARERWIAKSVDELRAKNNPKLSYQGQVLGGRRDVQNRGILGKVEKNRPDTYYINSADRYFTTTGQEKAQTARAKEVLRDVARPETAREYYGVAGEADAEASYIPGQYRTALRPVLDADIKHISNAHAKDKYDANHGDHGVLGYRSSVIGNNRMLTGGQREYGVVSSFAKAVVAPLMDFLRPSRKENVIGNLRPSGNAGNKEHHAGYVYNPNDKARTTIKEMTEDRKDHMYVGNQGEFAQSGITSNPQNPVSNQRDTTNCQHIGNGGNTQGTMNNQVYDAAYNANLINKEPISRGRAPMGDSVKMFNGESFTNIKIDKIETDRNNNRLFVPSDVTRNTPAKEQYGFMTARSEYGQGIQCERNQPEILEAFNSNPYAKSLHSYA